MPAKAGARIRGESGGALLAVAAQEAAGAGFDLVELAFAEIDEASIRALLRPSRIRGRDPSSSNCRC